MNSVAFTLNGKPTTVDVEADMPLLWVLRDVLKLTGTKYGCGRGLCGCCTVHIDGDAARSCMVPIRNVAGTDVVTIEQVGADLSHPVTRAWSELRVVQCGYCQPGQVMSAAALLEHRPDPSDDEIDMAMMGVLCRCGTYPRIRAAVRRAAELHRAKASR